jgi:phospholipase/lecithinase/hemolysin
LPTNAPYEVDNVGTQIESFLTNRQSFQENQLVTLWAGAGDLARVRALGDIVKIVDNLEGHIRTLNNNGAKTVVIPNQLDAGLAPFFDLPNTPDPSIISKAVSSFNDLLDSRLILLAEDSLLDISIISVDMPPLMQQILDDRNFVNTENAWLIDFSKGIAGSDDPNDYFFYDPIHPSAGAHNIIANKISSTVVPAPPTIFLLVVGFLIFKLQRGKA